MKIKSPIFKRNEPSQDIPILSKNTFGQDELPSSRYLAQQLREMMLGTLTKNQQQATLKLLENPKVMTKVLQELHNIPTPESITSSPVFNKFEKETMSKLTTRGIYRIGGNKFQPSRNIPKRKQLPQKLINSPPNFKTLQTYSDTELDNIKWEQKEIELNSHLNELNLSNERNPALISNSDTSINTSTTLLNNSKVSPFLSFSQDIPSNEHNLARKDSSNSDTTLCSDGSIELTNSEDPLLGPLNLKRRQAMIKPKIVAKSKARVVKLNDPNLKIPTPASDRENRRHYLQRAHISLNHDPNKISASDVKVVNKYCVDQDVYEGWNDDLDPPKDSVSVYVYWWGYEIYLPTEFLLQYQNDTSTLNGVLRFLATILSLVPIVLPFMAVITSFLSLHGDVLRMLSSPTGCILTATWILPIVVIPRPWRL